MKTAIAIINPLLSKKCISMGETEKKGFDRGKEEGKRGGLKRAAFRKLASGERSHAMATSGRRTRPAVGDYLRTRRRESRRTNKTSIEKDGEVKKGRPGERTPRRNLSYLKGYSGPLIAHSPLHRMFPGRAKIKRDRTAETEEKREPKKRLNFHGSVVVVRRKENNTTQPRPSKWKPPSSMAY